MSATPVVGVLLGIALSLAPGLPTSHPLEPQDLEQLIRAARTGRPVIRPQAARRILRLWSQAERSDRAGIIERLREETGDSPQTLALAGPALIEVLGEFEDENLRSLLWRAFDDTDFPWRPYGARSLAVHAKVEEAQRFISALTDAIAPVRVAALTALSNLGQAQHASAVRPLLNDEDGRVRRAAANLLADWNEPSALWWLYEELLRTDRFFDRPTGEQARYQAWSLLSPRLVELPGGVAHDPGLDPVSPASAASLAAVRARLDELKAGKRPEIPARVRAGGKTPTELLGLELRSCRRGEVFLRWTENDLLLVGQGNPAELRLPRGSVETLLATTSQARAGLSDKRLFGAPGCDMEQFHFRSGQTLAATQWIVSCGPETVPNLRPPGLNSIGLALLDAIPEISTEQVTADPRLAHLRERTRAALLAIGGDLD